MIKILGFCRTEDGSLLAISSTDGYVTFISFSSGELGKPYHIQPHQKAHQRKEEEELKSEKVILKEKQNSSQTKEKESVQAMKR